MPGGSLELKCVAVGSPMPFIKWRQGAIDLTPDDNLPVGRGVLELKDVAESKNYTCIAASELGSIEFVAQVRVKALPQPPTELSVSDVTPNSVKLTWTIAGSLILERTNLKITAVTVSEPCCCRESPKIDSLVCFY